MDSIGVIRGLADTEARLYPQLQELDLREQVPALDVPVWVVMGRHEAWCRPYFRLLEDAKAAPISFADALRSIRERTGRLEASFASKLVHTVDPTLPVLDRFVRRDQVVDDDVMPQALPVWVDDPIGSEARSSTRPRIRTRSSGSAPSPGIWAGGASVGGTLKAVIFANTSKKPLGSCIIVRYGQTGCDVHPTL